MRPERIQIVTKGTDKHVNIGLMRVVEENDYVNTYTKTQEHSKETSKKILHLIEIKIEEVKKEV